jgi:hypothetical protein
MPMYPMEQLGADDDDGTMPGTLHTLKESVVGRRIASVEQGVEVPDRYYGTTTGTVITLDDGRKVQLADTSDCCAYTELKSFLLNADRIDHVITGVGTTDGYSTWHVYADMGDVLELSVGWSCGNPFYYAYGFHITVHDTDSADATTPLPQSAV